MIFASDKIISLILEDVPNEAYFKVILNETLEEIGHISYTYENDSIVGNLSYFIYEEHRNKGYGKKALKLLVDNIRRIDDNDLYLAIIPNNIASIKLAKSQNAKYIGDVNIPTKYVFSDDGKYSYANMYKIKIKGE